MDYAHDGFGNNISHRVQGTAGASFNNFDFPALATNQIPSMTTKGGLTGWSMNPQGRAIQIGTGTSTSRALGLGWDGLGRLASVNSAAGTQRYVYAPTGLRVQVQDSLSPAKNRRYAYSSGGLLMSEFTQAGWKRDVVYLGSEAVVEVDEAGVHELHNDHLGTPRIVTSRATRMIEGRQAFGPYGKVLAAQTEGYRPLTGYTGHLQTEDTGLIYMRGLYYSPAWHRFLNSDQGADPSTWNQVAYVGGSPFMATDPSGMAGNQLKCVLKTTTWWAVSESGYRWITEIYRSNECTVIDGDPGGELGMSPPEPQTPSKDPNCVNGYRPVTPAEGQKIADIASTWVGTKYVSGGTTKAGADCTGSTCSIYGAAGFPYSNVAVGGRFSVGFPKVPEFRAVLGAWQVGDVIHFAHHVAIYDPNAGVNSTWASSNPSDNLWTTRDRLETYGTGKPKYFTGTPNAYRYYVPCE